MVNPMYERRSEGDLRDRITTLEVKLDNHADKLDEVVVAQNHANTKLDQIFILMAEARGAGKFAKAAWVAFIALLGGASGWIGSAVRHL
jgi:hypothetical protein